MISKFSSNGGVHPLGPEEENLSKNNARSISFKNGGVGESVSEVLGARIKRNEFDNEFLNDMNLMRMIKRKKKNYKLKWMC